MFSLLNRLQYILQRPFRSALKKESKTVRRLHKIRIFHWTYNLVMYFVLAPLRFVNAVWYDLLVYGVFSLKDHYLEIFRPRVNLWTRQKKGFVYFLYWFFGLPVRVLKNCFLFIAKLLEGALFTAIDTVVPTLTMMHGTRLKSSVNISVPGIWKVGSGNYAGTGIYFTMDKKTAEHYSGGHGSGEEGVIIYARVSLGRNLNLSVAPQEAQDYLRHREGTKLSRWGLRHHFTSYEWWRDDHEWWEYCMISDRIGETIKTWRIRILYIYNLSDKKVQRIWGGKSFWLG